MGPADQVNPQATINQGNQIAGEQQGYNTAQANQQTGITLGQIAPAQQAYNVGSQAGSQYNQANPYGNVNYQQTGTGPNGVPIYTANVGYSPQQQGLYNTQVAGQQTAGNQAFSLLNNANYGAETPQNAIGNMTTGITGQNLGQETASLDPFFNMQTTLQQNALAAQGITPTGNPTAYYNAMLPLYTGQQSTVANFLASQEPTVQAQAMSEYQLPATMAAALGSYGAPTSPTGMASQVGQPALGSTTVTPTQVQPVNVASGVSAITQSDVAAAQQQQAMYNALMGGLSGLGSAGILAAALSDAELKTDIVPIGQLPNGVEVVSFKYLWDDEPFIGVVAQQVAEIIPEAVSRGSDGWLRVDYARIGMPFMRLRDWLQLEKGIANAQPVRS